MSVANAGRQAALWVAHTRTRRSNHEARTIAFLHSGALNGMHKTGREKERKGGTSHHILEKVLPLPPTTSESGRRHYCDVIPILALGFAHI